MKTILIAAAALLAATAATAQSTAALTLKLDAAAPEGQVLIAIYDSKEAFDGSRAPVRTLAGKPGAVVRVEGLSPARYAIKAFHDVDGDGKFRLNPFGMPIEPLAFSNGARPKMGPPAWEDAAFELTAAGRAQTLSLK